MARTHQEEEEKKERKKAEKKTTKEKRRQEMHQDGKKAPQTAGVNGALVQNGKSPKGGSSKKDKSARKGSGKWSVLGIVNIFLLLAVIAASGTCAVLYAEGDLSMEGLIGAWPRAKRNSALLLNMTLDAFSYDNMKRTAHHIWKTVGPLALKVQRTLVLSYNTTKNLAMNALQAVGVGDLTPYLEGLQRLWGALLRQLLWLTGVAWKWLSMVDWEGIFAQVKDVAEFLADQFRVVNAEFWRNEAVVSAWEDAKPAREALWSCTESLRKTLSELYFNFQAHWWPVITEQTYYLYTSGKKSIESLLQ